MTIELKMRCLLVLTVIFCLLLVGCGDRELRGKDVPSEDGKTYLVVVDDNGGECGPLLVDDKKWVHPIGKPGPVSPGEHKIECGGAIYFTIREGTTFYFDYWGP